MDNTDAILIKTEIVDNVYTLIDDNDKIWGEIRVEENTCACRIFNQNIPESCRGDTQGVFHFKIKGKNNDEAHLAAKRFLNFFCLGYADPCRWIMNTVENFFVFEAGFVDLGFASVKQLRKSIRKLSKKHEVFLHIRSPKPGRDSLLDESRSPQNDPYKFWYDLDALVPFVEISYGDQTARFPFEIEAWITQSRGIREFWEKHTLESANAYDLTAWAEHAIDKGKIFKAIRYLKISSKKGYSPAKQMLKTLPIVILSHWWFKQFSKITHLK